MTDIINFVQETILYDGILHDLVFVLIALITLLAALCVVFLPNVVHSALFLIVSFMGVATLFFQLSEGFLALIQIMVYAGAISILIIFAIMLIMDKKPKNTNLSVRSIKKRMVSGYIAIILVLFLGISIFATDWPVLGVVPDSSGVSALSKLAELLFGEYLMVMEIAAVLIVVAVVGALVLTKGTDEK